MKALFFYNRCKEIVMLIQKLFPDIQNRFECKNTYINLKNLSKEIDCFELAWDRNDIQQYDKEIHSLPKKIMDLFKIECTANSLQEFVIAFQTSADAFVTILEKEWETQYKAVSYEPSY